MTTNTVSAPESPRPRRRGRLLLAAACLGLWYAGDVLVLKPLAEREAATQARGERINALAKTLRARLEKHLRASYGRLSERDRIVLAEKHRKAGRKAEYAALLDMRDVIEGLTGLYQSNKEFDRLGAGLAGPAKTWRTNRTAALWTAYAIALWLLWAAWLSREWISLIAPFLAKLGRLLLFPFAVAACFAGSAVLTQGDAGWSLDRARLKRHLWRSFWLAAALLSFCGLLVARMPLWGAGHFFWPLLWAAGALASLALYLTLEWNSNSPRPDWTAMPRLAGSGLLTVLAFVAGLYLAGTVWDMAGRAVLSRAKAAFAHARYSLDLPSPEPTVADADNAAIPYRQAMQAEEALSAADKTHNQSSKDYDALSKFFNRVSRNEPLGDAKIAVVDVLTRHAQTLAHVREASKRKDFAWGIEVKKPYSANQIPRYSSVLTFVRLLAADAVLAAEAGRKDESSKTLEQGFRFVRVIIDGRTLISEMIAGAGYGLMFKASMYAQNRPGTSPEASPWKAGAVNDMGQRVRRSINLNVVTSLADAEFYADYFYTFKSLPEEAFGIPVVVYAPFLRLDVASGLPLWTKMLDAMDSSEPPQAVPNLDTEASKAWILSALAMPKFNNLHHKALKVDAWFRLAEAAGRARRFKAKQGRWPDAVWELDDGKSTEALRDPFSGGWLKLIRWRGGVRIYSVGMDGVDDQGAPLDSAGSRETGDLAWPLM